MDNQEQVIQKEQKSKKPIYKKWWFWVVLVLAVGIIGAALGGNDSEDNTDNVKTEQTEGTTPTTKKESTSKTYKIGDTVKVGDFSFTITKVENTKQLGSDLLGAKTENNFAIVTVTVKNDGSSEKMLTSSSFSLYNGNNKYEPNSAGIYLGENGFYALKELGSGISTTIQIVYETPSEPTENWYMEFRQSYHSEKVYLK